ncbi:MAG: hypothetical protein ACI91V_000821 [Lentimonas sp.]|jgi:hypothetical protein
MNIFNSHSKERLFCDQGVVSKRSKIIAEPNLVAQARLVHPRRVGGDVGTFVRCETHRIVLVVRL